MNTVFIADDELIIRQGIKCIIDWEQLGFEIIGEASNVRIWYLWIFVCLKCLD